jgi:hypothetical protein
MHGVRGRPDIPNGEHCGRRLRLCFELNVFLKETCADSIFFKKAQPTLAEHWQRIHSINDSTRIYCDLVGMSVYGICEGWERSETIIAVFKNKFI